jgi:hypothetical protein
MRNCRMAALTVALSLCSCVPRPMQVTAHYADRAITGGRMAVVFDGPLHDIVAQSLPEYLSRLTTMDTCWFAGVDGVRCLCPAGCDSAAGDNATRDRVLQQLDADYLLVLCDAVLQRGTRVDLGPGMHSSPVKETDLILSAWVSLWDTRASAEIAGGKVEAVFQTIRGSIDAQALREVTRRFAAMAVDGTPVAR